MKGKPSVFLTRISENYGINTFCWFKKNIDTLQRNTGGFNRRGKQPRIIRKKMTSLLDALETESDGYDTYHSQLAAFWMIYFWALKPINLIRK